MKKAAKTVSLLLIVCTMVCLFTSCSKKLNGTYAATSEEGTVLNGSLTFDKDNNVKGELQLPVGGKVSLDGTYAIEDDEIKFTYEVFGLNKTLTYSFSKSGKSVIIDGSEFQKQ